jgi:hypothetical protein
MDMVWTLLPYWGLATQAPHWHEPRIGAIFKARVYSRRDLPPADVDTLALIRRERQSFLSLSRRFAVAQNGKIELHSNRITLGRRPTPGYAGLDISE